MVKRIESNSVLKVKFEYLFLLLGLIFGILFVFINPPYQTNDEDRHFYACYSISEGQFNPVNKNNMSGTALPKNLVAITQSFQGLPFYQGAKISSNKVKEASKLPLYPKDTMFYPNPQLVGNPLPYIPQVTGILIGKVINSNPIWLMRFGRLGSLLAYLLIIFFAIRITPIFKSVFFIYALTPMALYQGASITYDSLNIATSFLLIALALYYAFEKSEITIKDLIIFGVIALIHRFAKDGYILFPLLIFLVPPAKFGSIKKLAYVYPSFAVFFIVIYFLPGWTWGKYIGGLNLLPPPGGIKDFVYGSATDFGRLLDSPVHHIKNIMNSFLFQRKDWVGGVIGRFGYSYTLLPTFFMIIHGLVLLTVAFLDSRKDVVMSLTQKIIIFCAGFGTIGLIITGFYLSSPLGASNIFGLQGRYFVPAIPLVLLVLYNSVFELKFWTRWKSTILSLYMIGALTYTVIFMNGYFYGP
ncbi:MAG: DUF2142 domain-containing protein [Bacteroidetes bacterium]|nr:MAG: DUF2142 domain-containing protein [Bacteroidota bacterium]